MKRMLIGFIVFVLCNQGIAGMIAPVLQRQLDSLGMNESVRHCLFKGTR